jgi:type III pantothenate kinase
MYILGDIGNTETKLCLISKNNKIIKKIVFSSKNTNNTLLNNLFKKNKFKLNKVEKILFCSVVPNTFKVIKKFLSKKTKVKCFEVKNLKLKSLIKIKVDYKQVGSDRITNAISLMNNNKDNYIILDFGTATTFDVLIKNTYFGGIIAPGVKLSLNTLSDRATLIPKIELKKINKIIGSNTISAVRSGFFWGYIGLIDNIINLIKKETGKSFKVIITGGFSDLFKNSIKTKVNHNRDITIKGLIKISQLIK